MKDKYYNLLQESIEDAMELWIECVNEDSFAEGASMDTELTNFIELVKLLYDSRMFK